VSLLDSNIVDDERYAIPGDERREEQIIQRSRFVATVAEAATVEDAIQFVRRVAADFPDATHNCWAYAVGRPGSTDRVGMSDDGEPHGTAGRPMLSVLLHSGLGDVAAVVTRYYGGTKLGTGGLVRAYSSTLQLALDAVPRAERITLAGLSVVFAYPHLTRIRMLLPAFEAVETGQDFGTDVTLALRLPASRVEALRVALADATRGECVVEPTDPGLA
jgi:uncharacterized YigZ family protein